MPLKITNNILVLFAISIMAALALLREIYFFPMLDLIPNPDSAWLIVAAEKLLNGQKLYIDIMETNPPLIIWLSVIPVYVARIIGCSPFPVAVLLVTVLNLLSLWLVAKTLRERYSSAILLYIAFGFFLLTPALYGQRETLFIALILPYLFASLSRTSPSPLGRGRGEGVATNSDLSLIHNPLILPHPNPLPRGEGISLLIIAMAAIGFAIKPFFMLIWVMNELAIAIEKRKFGCIFAWHNWLIGFVQLAYFASIYVFTPAYITDIIPALMVTYFSFESAWEIILKPIAEIGGIMIFVLFLAKLRGVYARITLRVSVWFLGSAGLMILQRKDWLNHQYPMAFMAGLALTIALIYLLGEWQKLRLDIGHRKFVALCLAASVLVGGAYADGIFTHKMLTEPSKLSSKLLAEINEKADGKEIYPLVYSIQPSFPAIAISNGVFSGGFHHLWPLMGLIIREQNGDKTPEFLQVKQWFIYKIVRDFTKHPPELVWVDENVNMEKSAGYAIKPENRDIIKVLSRDVEFAQIWQHYVKYKEIEAEEYEDKDKVKTEEKKKKPEKYTIYIRY